MRHTILFMLLLILSSTTAWAETQDSPLGYWKTVDDITGKPKSIIKISEDSNRELVGKVIKVFPGKGHDQQTLCSACRGEKHNQPIVGMVILTGLKFKQSQWEKGSILDISNGKIYNCALRPVDAGKKLHVRGYIGLPLLGRSQTWLRVGSQDIA